MEQIRTSWIPPASTLIPLGVLSVCFLLGGGVGLALACSVEGTGGERLAQYLTAYLELAADGEVPVQLATILWEQLKLPLCCLALGFSALGVVGMPILFGVRGFSLVYGVACFCRIFGGEGLAVAGCLFGITALITVPALFVMGYQGLRGSYALLQRAVGLHRTPLPYDGGYGGRCALGLATVVGAAAVEWLIVPSLLTWVAPMVL